MAQSVSLPLSSACWSAFRAGGLAFLLVRSSRRSASGWVLLAGFHSLPAARAFARWSAARLGFSVVVRPGPGCWSVSVPFAPAAAPVSVWLSVCGGVRSFAPRLASFLAVAAGHSL
jgi:hypothetical protein